MKLATVLRYVELEATGPDAVWNTRYYIGNGFEKMAKENGVGLIAIMTEHDIESVLAECDGLVIPGSATNINPEYYGGEPWETAEPVDEYGFDRKIIEHFVKARKPIFGICGGMQELNIYFGGNMRLIPAKGTHNNTRHNIDIAPDSFVYDVYKSEKAEINSYHNWMLDKVAEGFKVVARSEEGIIEAIECKEKKIFAVQWHPELSYNTDNHTEDKFFKNFIECCKNNK